MRLMEEGKFREAEREKNRLEDEQRTRQKVRDESGTEWKPKYFEESKDKNGVPRFDFNGLYWKDRNRKDWSRLD